MNITGNYRLSPQQKHLWLQLSGGKSDTPYRAQCEILVEGELIAERLKKTLDMIVERHEIVRTIFQMQDGVDIPVQSVCEKLEPILFEKNLSNLPQSEHSTAIDNIFEETKQYLYEAESSPLVTFLVHLSADRHVLIVSLPALFADAKSLVNLTREIAVLYNSGDHDVAELDEPFQYVDFSEWQNENLESEETIEARRYWTDQQFNPNFCLYNEAENSPNGKFEPQVLIKKVDRETLRRINAFATNSGLLTGTFLVACWQILLWHLSGDAEFAIGLYADGRKFQEMDAALGLLGRYVPLQAKMLGSVRFNDFLKQLKKAQDSVIDNQEFFDWKQTKSSSNASNSEPNFSFGFEHFEITPEIGAGDSRFQITRQYSCLENFKLKLACVESEDSMTAEFYFDADKFATQEIERIADSFNQLLENALKNSTAEIADLEITSADENRRLLEEYNQTDFEFRPNVVAYQLFVESAAQTPDKIAVVCEDEKLTYAELNSRANQLARHLQSLGIKADTLCGICVERSIEMVVSVLAVFKAGAAYVPLDPNYPKDRLAYMLSDAKPQILITQQSILTELPENQAQTVLIDTEKSAILRQNTENLDVPINAETLAYLIYTSGSTGNPKGVMISHANLASYVQSLPVALGIGNSDRYLHTASISFSSSVRQMMLPLANGATVVIAKTERISNPLSLFELIKQQQATVLDFVPSFWRSCLYALDNVPQNKLSDLMDNNVRLALSASEPLPADIPHQLKAKFKPEVCLINMLGQTETTGIIATYPIENAGEQQVGIVPAGQPIGGTKIYLLDENLQPVPFGSTGEIYIGGTGIGRGYLNQTDLTAEKFVADPFGKNKDAKLYKTGDFGRYNRSGQIEFLGRADNQVKIRGHRVELGEIETALRQLEAVHEAVVALKTDTQNETKLVAYVVPKTANSPTFANRERYKLPNNMFIAQQNKYETDFFYEQIFKDQTNFKHGIKLKDGDCVVDVGANIGFFTMFVQQRWKNIKGYAFEPIPAIFDTLNINVKLYGNDTKTFRCGLAEESKEVVFTYYPNSSTQSGRYADEQEERDVLRSIIGNQEIENGVEMSDQYFDRLVENRIHGEKVVCPLKTLSQVMRENNIECIDLLKIDAEKSEFDVIRGIEADDWQKIKQITIEAHDIDGQLKRLIELLEKNGFTVFAEEDSFIKNSGLYNVYATREPRSDLQPIQTGAPYEIPFDENKILTASDLRQHLKDKLPEYYLPSNFVFLEQLPLSPNGKVDREALPPPEESRSTVEKGFVAPTDELEIRLTKIWESLLGINPIGIRDNFFDLGGHSLLAVKLFTQIEKLFGKNLPLATLFEAPTIEQLAVLLKQKGWTPSWSSLVTLQPNGTKRPFFCVHALGGNVLEYQPLARFLGADQPFYALQSYGLNKNHAPHKTIEEMAAHYIKEMRTVQPEGPYLLGGRSLGGTVAFEMACQLREQNQTVALLGLLDTDPMGYHKLLPESDADFHKVHRFIKRAKGHLSNLSTLSLTEKVDYFRGKAEYVPGKIKNKIWQAIYKLCVKANRPLPQILQSVQEFNFMAVMNYVPKIYPGKVTLFWAREDLRGSYDVQEGWNFLAGEVETHNIPGNHLNIVKEPYVQALAEKLKYCIEKCDSGENSGEQTIKTEPSIPVQIESENYGQLWNSTQQAIGSA